MLCGNVRDSGVVRSDANLTLHQWFRDLRQIAIWQDLESIRQSIRHFRVILHTLVIPSSYEISDSEEDSAPKIMTPAKRSRSVKTSAARKIIISTPQGRGEPRTSLKHVDPRSARRMIREAKLQFNNIEIGTSSADATSSQTLPSTSTSTASDPSIRGTADMEEDSDQPPDLVKSSYDSEDSDAGPK